MNVELIAFIFGAGVIVGVFICYVVGIWQMTKLPDPETEVTFKEHQKLLKQIEEFKEKRDPADWWKYIE